MKTANRSFFHLLSGYLLHDILRNKQVSNLKRAFKLMQLHAQRRELV
jgi:hypothetical protein